MINNLNKVTNPEITFEIKDNLNYSLIKTIDKCLSAGDAALSEVYSLLIVKTNNNRGVVHKFLYDISRQKNKAEEIFKLVSEYNITPNNISDIIEDLI